MINDELTNQLNIGWIWCISCTLWRTSEPCCLKVIFLLRKIVTLSSDIELYLVVFMSCRHSRKLVFPCVFPPDFFVNHSLTQFSQVPFFLLLFFKKCQRLPLSGRWYFIQLAFFRMPMFTFVSKSSVYWTLKQHVLSNMLLLPSSDSCLIYVRMCICHL